MCGYVLFFRIFGLYINYLQIIFLILSENDDFLKKKKIKMGGPAPPPSLLLLACSMSVITKHLKFLEFLYWKKLSNNWSVRSIIQRNRFQSRVLPCELLTTSITCGKRLDRRTAMILPKNMSLGFIGTYRNHLINEKIIYHFTII